MKTTAQLEQPSEQQGVALGPFPSTAACPVASVLHVINGEHYAGAERVQDLLAGALPGLGFRVGLACLKPDQFPAVRMYQEVPLYEVPMQGRLDLGPVWQLVSILRREGYGLVHAHTPRALMIAGLACLLTRVPLVYHVHSPAGRDSTRRWQNRINAAIERVFCRLASVLVAVSHSLGAQLVNEGVAAGKVVVVPNGVPRRTLRSERCESQPTWTLGTVALFRPRKGVEVLLEALAKLREAGLPVRLRAVGGFETFEYECEVQHLAERLGVADAIYWTGFTRDVDRELAQIDVLVLPSLFGEGLPMVVLEAMAAGVPVVASEIEGIGEVIRDGQNGLLTAPGDPAELARVLASLIRGESDWLSLRESALECHARRYSERAMAEGVAQVYRRVLGR